MDPVLETLVSRPLGGLSRYTRFFGCLRKCGGVSGVSSQVSGIPVVGYPLLRFCCGPGVPSLATPESSGVFVTGDTVVKSREPVFILFSYFTGSSQSFKRIF